MSRLTADSLRGIWAGVTMVWDEQYAFDEETYAQNIERTIAAGVHGIYTTGSTGEFYALEFEEFCRMVDIDAELCGRAGMPLQIGCNADATSKIIRMLQYVAGKPEVGAAQIALPYWMRLNERELLQFFGDLYSACSDLPLVNYNLDRAGRFLHADDYLRILQVAPNLIGMKYTAAGSLFDQLQEDICRTPQLSYFVGEDLLVSAMQVGARGSYSSVVLTEPHFMLEMYELAQAGRWEEALSLQQRVGQFFFEMEEFIAEHGEGDSAPVYDKGVSVATGCLLGHQRCRPPYIGWNDETIVDLRAWLEQKYPELIYRGD